MEENTHATPEMATLILEINEAEKKDKEIINKHRAQKAREYRAWKSKPDEERNILIKKGRGYKHNIEDPPSKWVRVVRKKIRYRLFRIREGKSNYDKGLKAWMEKQFTEDMNWGNFTFEWDVAPLDPLKVITPMEWVSAGGNLVKMPGTKIKACDPPAFTRQEI